jgi:hypothetical protein
MELHELAQRGLALQEQFVPYTGDQSFLNYCVAAKRWRNAQAAHVIPELWSFTWAGSTFMRQHDIFVEAFRTGTFRSKRFPFIHWAGFEPNPNIPNQNVYYSFRIRHGSSFEKLRFALRWRYKRWRTRGAAKIRAKVAPK